MLRAIRGRRGARAVLAAGALVSICSENDYESDDLAVKESSNTGPENSQTVT
jgi:hypothetical protein